MQRRFEWSKTFTNGDSYKGEAVGDNIKDGRGVYRWAATGATYDGEWRKDLPHGSGTMRVPGPEGYEYQGSFVDGKRSGQGRCRFGNGRLYEGSWHNDQMEGHGTLMGAPPPVDDFKEYHGTFLRGSRTGRGGRCLYHNGDIYQGDCQDGRRHGVGEWHLHLDAAASGGGCTRLDVVRHYRGKFVDNAARCDAGGELTYVDGSRYKGGVRDLLRHGVGEHHLANGDCFTGEFHQNMRDGRGTLRAADGSVWEGTFRRNVLDGQVVYRRGANRPTSGSNSSGLLPVLVAYTGPCTSGNLTGLGARMSFADGSVYHGEARDGQPTGHGLLEGRAIVGLPASHFGSSVLITRYEGGFFSGAPAGEGTATLQLAGTSSEEGARLRRRGDVKGLQINYHRSGTYTGTWSRGLPQGGGCWAWDSGDTYRGEVSAGLAQGCGTYWSAEATYDGEFHRGQPSGRGVYSHLLLHENYDGTWRDGLFDGHGTLRCADPSHLRTYTGSWRAGQQHGRGVEESGDAVDGETYDGEFVEGKRHGPGVLRSSQGQVYEGAFAHGEQAGAGTLTLPDGTVATGSFVKGVLHGECCVVYGATGMRFKGTFDHGRVSGVGEIMYQSGDRYVGEVEPASADRTDWTPHPHGKGTYFFSEGNRLECTWRHNVLHGTGTYTTYRGEVSSREYVDGAAARRPSTSGNIFTPENEFPNTQSEAALRERLQSMSVDKPHRFVRKGDSRQAGNATTPIPSGSPATVPVASPSGPSGGHRTTPPAASVAPKPRSTSPQKQQKRPSTSGKSLPVSSAEAPLAKGSPPTLVSTRKGSAEAGDAAEARQRRGMKLPTPRRVSPHAVTIGSSVGATPAVGNAELPLLSAEEAFQQGICRLNDVPGRSPVASRHKSHAEAAERKSVAYSFRDAAVGGGEVRPSLQCAVRGPLKGPLKDLMREASAIRNSKEDEIHTLTDELRRLNERIWQLRFSISGATTTPSPQEKQRLTSLRADRKGGVEKLMCLLEQEDEGL